MFTMSPILRLMRLDQWIKNTFVIAPLLFSGLFTDWSSIQLSLSAFLIFCFASSATYILNDYRDVEDDKKHPVKSTSRPLASGDVTKAQARVLLMVLYGVIFLSATVYPKVSTVIAGYLLLNIAYTFYFKHQPVLDIFTIAIGFVLRVYAGSVALNVPLSSWMFITTLSLALYLASIKRRQELRNSGESGRNVLQHYTVSLIEKYAEMSATSAILFYSLYIISDKPNMVYTIPFVLFGLYRYWFVVEAKGVGESPIDVVYSDILLLLTVLGWVVACFFSLSV
ncbi:decaprenyl-phosphate phosphoribosyltransferase [Vibrio breoganii]